MFKKILTLCLLASAANSYAQAPRTQLYEVFSGENCGPCASANPTTHALLTANSSAIIGLKYQVPIPSAGPIHLQNPTEPNARRTYYGVNSAPNARHEGQIIGNGHSLNLTQTIINNRQSVTSPFTIQLEHSFNANWDSIFVSMTVTAAQAVTSGNWFARIALIERHMNFPTPPGSNGETDFYSVMRKMLPNPTGTSLPATWTNGQSQVITIAAPVPTFIRDIAELGVVAFVQDDITKEIAQAKKSDPLPVPLNSKLEYNAGGFYVCTPAISPQVSITNQGTTPITSLQIRQTIGTNVQTINWTGTLAPNATTNVALNSTNLPTGRTTFEFRILTMNGAPHPSQVRATAAGAMFYTADQVNTVTTSFQGTFPPTNWAVDNGASATNGWSLGVPGANGTQRSARINFYDIGSGEIDYLYLPRMDMSQAAVSANLFFHVAHAQYTTSTNDKLEVEVSTDCGASWNVLYDKSGAQLSTRAPQTAAYNTVAANEWRQETVSLSSVVGQNDVLVRFKGTSNYGNNLFVDEVLIPNTVSVKEQLATIPLRTYPNPVKDELFIDFNDAVQGTVRIQLLNSLGQLVMEHNVSLESSATKISLNVATLPAGIYTAQSLVNGKTQLSKIVKQ
ncbi:MAG: T9SS type A sorting domain-containing protein [Sphingobacteriaceae bacterium]|nr:T9SS type A sorting domain-containing protein [Sphingobacteriaceae bacterium]